MNNIPESKHDNSEINVDTLGISDISEIPDTFETTPYVTKYEKSRLIGIRAEQIANGAKTLVDVGNIKDPIEIAEIEFYSGKNPLKIRRYINGEYRDIHSKELIIRK